MSVNREEPAPDATGPAAPYDEMTTALGEVRPHYAALDARLATLSPEELAERQRTQERFFLLQGITFTVYGAESSTERIIPSDILPRIIPGAEWARVEAGLVQRLKALIREESLAAMGSELKDGGLSGFSVAVGREGVERML